MGDCIENYQTLNLVGRGGFAEVYRGICRDTGEEVAIKMIDKTTIVKKRMEKRVQAEVLSGDSKWITDTLMNLSVSRVVGIAILLGTHSYV